MMKALVSGVPASKIFRSLIEADASIDARKLGDMLSFNYPNISPAASMAIRKWLSPGKEYEVSDEDMDALISHYLKESGYIT
jgi:predicted DNA-binding protein (MmcQ/YjbR family)